MAARHHKSDVLVVGGGPAGCFAAIKAKEQGVDVVLVDKGYVGKTCGFCIDCPEEAITIVPGPKLLLTLGWG